MRNGAANGVESRASQRREGPCLIVYSSTVCRAQQGYQKESGFMFVPVNDFVLRNIVQSADPTPVSDVICYL